MIDQSIIDRILSTARVEEVIGDYVSLKRRGVNQIGSCPFHNEKTPSFIVSPAKGIYKCFGCGASGNVLRFVMDYEKIGFVDALKILGKRYGIEVVSEEESEESRKRRQKREGYLLLLNWIADKYHSILLSNVDDIQRLDEMGIRSALVSKFHLGSIDSNVSIKTEALKKGFKKEYLIDLGILDKEERELLTNHFILPIYNESNKIIGFYGIDKDSSEISITPESPVFKHQDCFYGLSHGKNKLIKTQESYIVLSPIEVLLCHDIGIENVIAPLTPDFSENQLHHFNRYVKMLIPIVSLQKQTYLYPLLSRALKEGYRVKIATLNRNNSVSDILSVCDGDQLNRELEHTQDWMQYLVSLLVKHTQSNTIQREKGIERLLYLLLCIDDSIVRGVYINELSRQLNIDEQVVRNEMSRLSNKR